MVLSRLFAKGEKNVPVRPADAKPEAPKGVTAGACVSAFRRAAVQAVADGTIPAEAFRRKADESVPGDPQSRGAWVTAAIDRTLTLPVTSTVYSVTPEFLTELSRHVEESVDLEALARSSEGFCMAFERMASGHAARCAWFVSGPERTLRRISLETENLLDLTPEQVAARFSRTPASRLDAVPPSGIAMRSWISDMLHGEAAAISAGLMPPADVMAIAFSSHIPVEHVRADGGTRTSLTVAAFHPAVFDPARHDERTDHLSGLARDILLSRFADIPGFEERASRAWGGGDWRALVAEALLAEELRGISGLAYTTGPEDEVELTDIHIAPEIGGAGFTATLVVFGERVCRITCDARGEVTGDEWSEGCSPEDLEVLDTYIASTGEPRDDGETPDSLAMRIMDIVTVFAMIEDYRAASRDAVLFGIDGPSGEMIHAEPLPEGVTREQIIEAYLDMAPRAVPLDRLDDLSAAELWLSLKN
jgi:hypothetical protein